jgi:hypothetical protein
VFSMRAFISAGSLKRSLPLALGLMAFAMAAKPALANHGVSLAAANDYIRVTIQPKGGAYNSWCWVKQEGTGWQYLGRSDETGRVTTLRVLRNKELKFAIVVVNTGQSFHIGPGWRNGDNLVHAEVYQYGPAYRVGWEDIYGSSDEDYNDAQFVVEGAYLFNP